KRAYCLKTQPATGETYPKSDLFNKASWQLKNGLNLNGLNLLAVNPDFRTLPHFRVIILNVFNKRCY
ncbi:hypothetical protein, partial [Klebsiella pneumoniae]|uniref:hypothetical protein n=1 Tax=Klebsiella pneumoniae TaxID=573 RepID=UPI001C5953DC